MVEDAGVIPAFFLFLVVRCGAGIHFWGKFCISTRNHVLTTPVAQLAQASCFGVGGIWIKADHAAAFSSTRPAPTQEMAVNWGVAARPRD